MPTAFQSSGRATDRRWIFASIAVPSVLAWIFLVWAGTSPQGRWFHHDGLEHSRAILPLVLIGWVVMIAAMMLPTTAPLVATFATVVGGRRHHRRLVGLLLLGYVAVWTIVGAAAITMDLVLHRVADPAQRGGTSPVMVTILVVAGIYQFTPLKRRCLTECRSPYMFVAQRWHGGDPNWEAFALGAAHGWFCVGCCWTLMVVMFAIGMGNIGWMLALAGLMAVEKNVARAAWLSPTIGVGLLVSALWLVLV